MLSDHPDGADADSDAVRRATASIRGAALAVLASAARALERLDETTDGAGATALVTDVRTRLEHASRLLGDLEGRPVTYEQQPPEGAPVTGWQVPVVAAARAWLDEAHDAALRAVRSGHAT